MATKSSILIFYLRLSKNTQRILRTSSYVTLAIVNVAGVVLTFLNIFQCNPVSAAYSPGFEGKCISIVTLFLCSAPVNIITDLAILILPIPILTGMTLPQRQKIVLVFTFTLGIFVMIVDVIRIYYLQQASDDQLSIMSQTEFRFGMNFYFNASSALKWSAVEVNIGIICACIPTLKPLIKRILPAMITARTGSGTKEHFTSEQASDEVRRASGRASAVPIQPVPEAQESPAQETPALESPTHENPAQGNSDQEREMGMMDFLTTPGDQTTAEQRRSVTTHGNSNSVYFGFIDMKRPKSMLKTRGMESFKYCTIVTILFFLWGFSYGLLNILNIEIAKIAHESEAQTLGLSAAYFGAYFFGPLTLGQWVLRHGGFKATFISGLCIYGTGTLMLWPSAVLVSFPGFIICQFVVGFGLSVLETAANPFLALCGPSQYAEARLLLAQGVQGIGTVLSQLLAHKLFFRNLRHQSLIDVQWAYLAITLFTAILALFFYYMPLPEASDADLDVLAATLSITPHQTIGTRLPLVATTLAVAVLAQTLYVGAQEAHSTFFSPLLTSLSPPALPTAPPLTLSLTSYTLLAATALALGRFLFALLTLIPSLPPRTLLLFLLPASILISTLLSVPLRPINANKSAGLGLVFSLLEGPFWPMIFAIGLRGQGANTKRAASRLTAGAAGGAAAPFIMYGVQRGGGSVRTSYFVVVGLMVAGLVFPLYLISFPGARRQVDPIKTGEGGLANESLGDVGGLALEEGVGGREDETPIRRFSRRFSEMFSTIGGKGGGSDGAQGQVAVEHREEGTA
jgi:fucose permease